MPDPVAVETFAAVVEASDYLRAIERFYAPDASKRENNDPPTVGRDALLEGERRVLASFKSVTARRLSPILSNGDQVAILWRFEFTSAEGSVRILEEVAWQIRRDGRIVEEQFFYDSKQLAE